MSDSQAEQQQPIALVIFGATGDLTSRKLAPALFRLCQSGHLPGPLRLIGFARREWDDRTFQKALREAVLADESHGAPDKAAVEAFVKDSVYIRAAFEDKDGYRQLADRLEEIGVQNRLFYLATPPEAYPVIIQQIGKHKLANCPNGWTRIVVEKPYGHDLESARALDREVHRVFEEDQVYRIDHYLGKETVQNILVFRFGNGIFEPLWNRRYIHDVQITVAEAEGVGTRAGYYEQAGVIRDMFQNHILQLLTLTAMEAPVAFTAHAVRDEKLKILEALRPIRGDEVNTFTLRAQYVAGSVEGERVPGYKDEPKVAPDSMTETLMAAVLHIDNWRWAGVPFFIRSGKRLPKRVTEISIQFNQAPLSLFNRRDFSGEAPNRLIITIQPDEGITLTFGAKVPGPETVIQPVAMNFDYTHAFGGEPPEAYERLLLDALLGDATLFTRSDEVLAAWAFTTEILAGWEAQQETHLPVYEAGTWGPTRMDDFIGRRGCVWRDLA